MVGLRYNEENLALGQVRLAKVERERERERERQRDFLMVDGHFPRFVMFASSQAMK